MEDSTKVCLGHDIVSALVDGLSCLYSESYYVLPPKELKAVAKMLREADLVTLTFGLNPSCSLALREGPDPRGFCDG